MRWYSARRRKGETMIYTLTANPSLDYIVRVKNLRIGETNRAYETEIFAGGKDSMFLLFFQNLDIPPSRPDL